MNSRTVFVLAVIIALLVVIIISIPPQPPEVSGPLPQEESYCGDGACDYGEDCETCAQDCGNCPPPETLARLGELLPTQQCDFSSDGEAYQQAAETLNLAICNCIEYEPTKENCERTVLDSLYYERALNSLDIRLCDMISGSMLRDVCKNVVQQGLDFLSENETAYLAQLYQKSQNWEGTIELLESQDIRDDFESLVTLALAYAEKILVEYSADQYLETALAAIDRAIELEPDNPVGYKVKGYVYEASGDLFKALEWYTKAIEIDPKHIPAYIGRGHAYNKLGDLPKALADFEKAKDLDVNETYEHIYAQLCRLYSTKADQLDDAIENCLKVLEGDFYDVTVDDKLGAHIILAELYMIVNRFDEAYTHIQSAMVYAPESPDVLVALSKWYFLTEDYAMARDAAERALSKDPMKAAAYYSLSRAAFYLGDTDTAIEAALHGLDVIDDDVSLLIPQKPSVKRLLYYQLANIYDFLGDEENERNYAEMGESVYAKFENSTDYYVI